MEELVPVDVITNLGPQRIEFPQDSFVRWWNIRHLFKLRVMPLKGVQLVEPFQTEFAVKARYVFFDRFTLRSIEFLVTDSPERCNALGQPFAMLFNDRFLRFKLLANFYHW